jgi:putative peptide zinc metalloprotease protein
MATNAASIPAPGSDATERPKMVIPLREDLDLYPGPRTPEGAQTWTLYDAIRNRFFKMGWLEFEMLKRWKRGNVDAIAAGVSSETAMECRPVDVMALQAFLEQNQLVRRVGPGHVQRLVQLTERMRKLKQRVRLQQLMFLRIPLFKPDHFLAAALPYVRFVFTRTFVAIVALVGITGLVLASQQWESFTHTFRYAFTLEGMLLFGVAIFITKCIHELGHAFTAKYLGLRVSTMGLAFLILWPVFYTDTTDSWRLRSHLQRARIGIAGVAAELILACFATLIWNFLPEGPLRSIMFFMAAVSWILTVIINLNPFMRWDGYYVLSDLLGVENLQQRAFAVAKWWLRERLWGLGENPPEHFSRRRQRTLILYAVGTWMYRLLLFTTISVVLYGYTFKVMGILMFVTVMNSFIIRPVSSELTQWWRRRTSISPWRRATVLGGIVGLLGLFMIYPWSSSVEAPALWQPAKYTRIYAPAAARIAKITVSNGDKVKAGDILLQLERPNLEHEQRQTALDIALLRAQLARQGASAEYLDRSQVLERQLAEALARYRGNRRELVRLAIRAPTAGRVTDIPDTVRVGRWVPDSFLFGAVIGEAGAEVTAYVSEANLSRLRTGGDGRFYTDDPDGASFPVVVKEIDRANVDILDEPYSASVFGGGVAVRKSESKQLTVHESMYRVRLLPQAEDGGSRNERLPPRMTRGSVRLQAESESLVSRLRRLVSAVFIRESGF